MALRFDYWQAFARNLGWLTTAEQAVLRRGRIAIAGLGGVGGSHLLTLTRLGIGGFHIADFDRFEPANFNRQAGAGRASLDRPKVEVLAEAALDINPELHLVRFPEGVRDGNLEAFLAGIDVYVDGLDFFAFDIRRKLFAACARLGIPAVTAAPLGLTAALLVFLPGGITFEDYFGLAGHPEDEQGLRFFVGLAPAALHRDHLVDPGSIDFQRRIGPSTRIGCDLCAGLAAAEALKILLRRGPVWPAPHAFQCDAHGQRVVHTWRPAGHRNPLQRLALARARRAFAGLARRPAAPEAPAGALGRILDLARWAPSGDNTQPWRFAIDDDRRCAVHGLPPGPEDVYDLDGRSARLALGALLENIAIAAPEFGYRAEFRPRAEPAAPVIEVELAAVGAAAELSPLLPWITVRATQRRALSARALPAQTKRPLEQAAGPGFRILWLDGFKRRLAVARLLFRNAGIRLRLPEAYAVHRSILAWNSRQSADRIPDHALGLDPLTRRLLRFSLASPERAARFTALPGGTLVPRFELDFWPALRCGAHFALIAAAPPRNLADELEQGRALQRVWLTATRLGLRMQPEMTPVIFSRYVREDRRFTVDDRALRETRQVAADFAGLVGGGDVLERTVFFGRVGWGPAPTARSLRRPLAELLWRAPEP